MSSISPEAGTRAPALGERRLLLVDAYPFAWGGAVRILARIGVGLGARGWQVQTLVPAPGPTAEWLRAQGLQVQIAPTPPALLSYGSSTPLGRALLALPGYWRRLRPLLTVNDVVWVNDLRGMILLGPVVRTTKARLVWHVHSHPPALRRLSPVLARLAHVVVVPTRAAAAGQGLGRRTMLLPNPVDDTPGRGEEPELPCVVTMTRLYPLKGIEELIRAMAVLNARGVDVRCRVLGGPQPGFDAYPAVLEGLIAELGLQDRVELAGHVSDVPAALTTATVYVQPSRDEAFGFWPPWRQWRRASPSSPQRSAGFRSFLDEGRAGLLVPPKDPTALADALEFLLADRQRRDLLGAAGRARALTAYSPALFVDRERALRRHCSRQRRGSLRVPSRSSSSEEPGPARCTQSAALHASGGDLQPDRRTSLRPGDRPRPYRGCRARAGSRALVRTAGGARRGGGEPLPTRAPSACPRLLDGPGGSPAGNDGGTS